MLGGYSEWEAVQSADRAGAEDTGRRRRRLGGVMLAPGMVTTIPSEPAVSFSWSRVSYWVKREVTMRTASSMNWPRIRRASQQSRLGDVVMRLGADPRHFQITVLGSLLLYGISVLSFPVGLAQVAVLLGSALATQAVVGLAVGSRFDLPARPTVRRGSRCS